MDSSEALRLAAKEATEEVVRLTAKKAMERADEHFPGQRLNKGVALQRLLHQQGFDLTHKAIQAWSRGTMPPSAALFAAARVTGISLDDMLFPPSEPPTDSVSAQLQEIRAAMAELKASYEDLATQVAGG